MVLMAVSNASHWDTGDWDAIPPHIPASPQPVETEPDDGKDDDAEEEPE